jgi:arylsulfate sulfotransferase
VASLVWNDAPGLFSVWGGSINQLPNGNTEFDINGLSTPPPGVGVSEVHEVTQVPTPQIIWQMDFDAPSTAYRAYRVPSLYPGVNWAY